MRAKKIKKDVMDMEEKIKDLETVGDGFIERFNVVGLAPAVGAFKHITAKRYGSQKEPLAFELEISGMLPLDEEGVLVGNDCGEQTSRVIGNIATAIMEAGTHYGLNLSPEEALEHVTSTMVLLEDMANFGEVNSAYVRKGMPLACRAAFAVRELPLHDKGVMVEIRANALLPVHRDL